MLDDRSDWNHSRTVSGTPRQWNTLLREISVLADIAGFDIDEWTAEGGVAAARQDMTIVAGQIKAGTAAAQRIIIYGRSGGGNPSLSDGSAVWFCSDEHVVFSPPEGGSPPQVGDQVRVLPAHVDPTVAYHERLYLVESDHRALHRAGRPLDSASRHGVTASRAAHPATPAGSLSPPHLSYQPATPGVVWSWMPTVLRYRRSCPRHRHTPAAMVRSTSAPGEGRGSRFDDTITADRSG